MPASRVAIRARQRTGRFVVLVPLLLVGCSEQRPDIVDPELQKRSIDLLQQHGGGHSTYNTSPFNIEMAWFESQQATDEVLTEILRGAPQVRVLKMRNSDVSDAGLAELAEKAPYLEHLEISGMPLVTDVGLMFLEDLERLDYLYLMDTGATEEAARAFEEKMGLGSLTFKINAPSLSGPGATSPHGPADSSEDAPHMETESDAPESEPSIEILDAK
jgi:hypothetical protein